jgi:hypothetical protein
MKMILVQTPTCITSDIRTTCKNLSKFKPIFIDITAPSWSIHNKCSLNAKRFSEEYGGNVIFGWDVAVWKNVLIDCIGHAVVLKDDKFTDVTPNKYGNSKSLFVQDDNITFDYTNDMSRMPSKMIAISKAKEVRRLITLEEEIYNIKIKYPITSGEIALNPNDGMNITKLEKEKQELIPKIIRNHTHHSDPCICGSGKKFRKCCQNKFR